MTVTVPGETKNPPKINKGIFFKFRLQLCHKDAVWPAFGQTFFYVIQSRRNCDELKDVSVAFIGYDALDDTPSKSFRFSKPEFLTASHP
jgi:hypothetical protein